jgi:hypothetical protein
MCYKAEARVGLLPRTPNSALGGSGHRMRGAYQWDPRTIADYVAYGEG